MYARAFWRAKAYARSYAVVNRRPTPPRLSLRFALAMARERQRRAIALGIVSVRFGQLRGRGSAYLGWPVTALVLTVAFAHEVRQTR